MSSDLVHVICLGAGFLGLFMIGELLYHKFGFKAEVTRKWSHMGTGILALSFPWLIESHWYVLILSGVFAMILFFSIKLNFFQSINAVERKTHGSLLYPLSVYCCFLAFSSSGERFLFYLPILTLAISDPLATFFGKKYGASAYRIFSHQKTYLGSGAFFVSALVISVVGLLISSKVSFNICFGSMLFATVTTLAEAMSTKGWDNLTVPIFGLVLLIVLGL